MRSLQLKQYTIRLLTASDGRAFFRLMDENRSRLEDFFAGTVAHTKSLEATINYCSEIEEKTKNRTYYAFVVEDVEGRLIALLDVKNIDWAISKAELGGLVDVNIEGQGIATAMLRLMSDYLVEEFGFKKLFCRIAPRNKGSIRVVEQNGFELEGVLRREYKTTKGEIVDLNYYGKLYD